MSLRILIPVFLLVTTISYGQVVEGKLLGSWSDTTLVSSTAFDNVYNEVWGYAADNREYAIIGTTLGTHFFDITDPTEPTLVQLIRGGSTGNVIIHRDYHDHDGFLYAVSDEGSNSTLQIMDLSTLPDSVSVIYDSKQYIRRSHNIFIDTSSSIMYCCATSGDELSNMPLRLFDISDPYEPTPIAAFDRIGNYNVGDVHDAYVRNDTAYLNCGTYGFVIADFSDPTAPINLATLTTADYPDSGYNHSGWLSDDGQTYVMADETWNKDVKLMDVSQLPEVRFITTVDANNSNIFSLPHNQIVHGDYLYIAYYYDGLQVYDIKDPMTPIRIMHYPTSGLAPRRTYEGAWGIYPFLPSGNIIVSDMQEGLFIIDAVKNTISSTIENDLLSDLVISPNPNLGKFDISSSESLSDADLSLYTLEGLLIIQLDNSGSYDLDLLPGSYFLKIQQGEKLTVKKIVIGY